MKFNSKSICYIMFTKKLVHIEQCPFECTQEQMEFHISMAAQLAQLALCDAGACEQYVVHHVLETQKCANNVWRDESLAAEVEYYVEVFVTAAAYQKYTSCIEIKDMRASVASAGHCLLGI